MFSQKPSSFIVTALVSVTVGATPIASIMAMPESAQALSQDFNVFSSTFGTLDIGERKRAKVNNGDFGHVYFYLTKNDAETLAYSIKHFKNDTNFVTGVGFAGNFVKFVKNLPGGQFVSTSAGLAAFYYGNRRESFVIDIKRCAAKDSTMWVNAYGGALFLNPQVSCGAK